MKNISLCAFYLRQAVICLVLFSSHSFAQTRTEVNPQEIIAATLSSGKVIQCYQDEPVKVIQEEGLTYVVFNRDKKRKKIKRLKSRKRSGRLSKAKFKNKKRKLNKRYKKQLAACQAASGPIPPPESDSLQPYTGPFTRFEAHHLFRRAGFGATPEQINKAISDGLTVTVNELLNPIATPSLDAQADAIMEDASWSDEELIITAWGIKRVYLNYAVKSPNQLQEKMVYFLHDLWAASYRVLDSQDIYLQQHVALLYKYAFGNMRDFALEVTRDPMMLEWLDGVTNHVGNVNENYARELWELFTLGEGQYTENDVNESARALTGWIDRWNPQLERLEYYYDADLHDTGIKTIFEDTPYEATGNFDEEDIIELTFNHPRAAQFLAERLLQFFVQETVAQPVIDELATRIRENDFDLEPVLRILLNSELFFSAQARKTKIKTPLEQSIGFIRHSGVISNDQYLEFLVQNQGLDIFNPPSVKGWDDNVYWLSSQWLLERANFASAMFNSYDYLDADVQDFQYLLLSDTPTPTQFIQNVATRLDVTLSDADMETLISYLTTVQQWDGGEFTWDFQPDLSVEEDLYYFNVKAAGLLLLLSQHTDYFMG